MKIDDFDREILGDLKHSWTWGTSHKGWVRPLDIGASNGSRHSNRLNKLVRYGLVERRARGFLGGVLNSRGSYRYRLTGDGFAFLAANKES